MKRPLCLLLASQLRLSATLHDVTPDLPTSCRFGDAGWEIFVITIRPSLHRVRVTLPVGQVL